jgi:hypothetical protein
MTEEEKQDSDVKEDAPPDQLVTAQELTRLRAPSVLATVEPHPASEEVYDHAEIGIEAEQEIVDEVGHGRTVR